jgi:hypothetical protein
MFAYLHEFPAVAEVLDDDALRHWSPGAESYTGCDALFGALGRGWQIVGLVFRQECWFSGRRCTYLYTFQLWREGERVHMAVLQSPHVERFIAEAGIQVFHVERAHHPAPASRAEMRETVEARQVVCA